MSVAVQVTSVPNSIGRSPEAEGVGTAGEEKDAATKGTVAVGDSEEDGEGDVFEVERILDMKCEGVCGGCATRTRPEGRGGDRGGRILVGRGTAWNRLGGRCQSVSADWHPGKDPGHSLWRMDA